MTKRPRFKRLLLKVSGEILSGSGSSFNVARIKSFAEELAGIGESGVEIAIVIGGGNILRGINMGKEGISRVAADSMGMLGTIINAIALRSVLDNNGVDAMVMTAIAMERLAEPYKIQSALEYLEKGKMLILAGGTGNPYFTTDTAAALRSIECRADVLLKGTKVDGIYTSDPVEDSEAVLMKELSYTEVLKDELKVMDAAAVALCRENSVPIIVFNIMKKGNLKRILAGEMLGTIVK